MSNGHVVSVGRVTELWRYPVKSTLGEQLEAVDVGGFVAVPIEGFGSAPCLGAHATVVAGGSVTVGDEVVLTG